jgi:hypothetical protein
MGKSKYFFQRDDIMKKLGLRILTSAISFLIVLLFAFGVATADAKTPVNLPDSTMSIPWSDFKDMLEKLSATQAGPIKEKPPYDALISNADYTIQVKEHIALIRVRAEIVVLKQDGWSSVPVMKSGAHLDQVRLNGEPAALVKKSDGLLYVIADEPGIHILDLKYEAPLNDSGGPKYLNFPTLESPVNHLTVEISQPNQQVTFGDGKILKSSSAGAKTTAAGSFKPGSEQTIQWAQSVKKQARAEARVSAESNTLATVGEGLVVYTTIIEYTIQHKAINTFTLVLPESVVVADVSTDGLVDWNVEKSDGEQKLIIQIAYEAMGKHQVAVTFEDNLPAETESVIETADIRVLDVVRDAGVLGVAVRGNVQVETTEAKNLAPLDLQELPPDMQLDEKSKVLFGYKYIRHPATAKLKVIRHRGASVLSCVVERADYKIMITDRGKELLEASYIIANRTRQYISLTLPEGMDLWGVYRDGNPIHAADRDGKILLPVFGMREKKSFEIKILAYKERKFGKYFGKKRFDIPLLDAPVHSNNLSLFLPKSYKYFALGGNLGEALKGGFYSSVQHASSLDETASSTIIPGKSRRNISGKDLEKQEYRSLANLLAYDVNLTDDADVKFSINEQYTNVMTRRALSVQFDVVWEGKRYDFSTRIVDPNEGMYATVKYIKEVKSNAPKWIVLIAAIFMGYIGARWTIERLGKIKPTHDDKHRLFFIIAVLVVIVLSPIAGVSLKLLVFILILGAVLPAASHLLRKIDFQKEISFRKTKPKEPVKTGEIIREAEDLPKTEKKKAALTEEIPVALPVEESDDENMLKESDIQKDESPKGGE